ncbi:carbamate kinase [uncultured Fretibacterium sp.]|uniref:carbamate kinase n=1 Tax=uncultured Fretibacterium sp. TaxID=1678694 RepID=UPI002639CA33|nr:carbamate kinase [uncultured Fretibacterium sp.]
MPEPYETGRRKGREFFMGRLAVVAIGGNSLIRDEDHKTVADQYAAICETAVHIADMIESGCDVVITHGNGPQVGFALRRSEIAEQAEGMHPVPLVNCGADTQGAIGYQIQQAMGNEFRRRRMKKTAVTVVTQVLVDADDPAFGNPSKPIGSFFGEEQVERVRREHPDWALVSDAGRGYRRVVASPRPKEIVEATVIESLLGQGHCLVAVGGGGIPVVRRPDGTLEGRDAVIDKDFASSFLASRLGADLLVISTGVPQVCVNFGRADQRALSRVTVADLKRYADEGHFAPGSMLPKIQAVIQFMERPGREGRRAVITDPQSLSMAVADRAGTQVVS